MSIKSSIKDFYNNYSLEFSNTRKKEWPEFKYIVEEIEQTIIKKWKIKILELWCWDWRLFNFLNKIFWKKIEYLWVDISKWLIEIAKKNNNFDNCNFIISDMLDFLENRKENEQFDFVIAVASLQHIPTRWERLLILKHTYRILLYNWKFIMFNWSFSKWFFKKYKAQILKSLIIWILSLWTKSINDIMVPWKSDKWTIYRYYHIFFMFELKMLLKQTSFLIEKNCYINKRWEKSISRIDSRNSCIIAKKWVLL